MIDTRAVGQELQDQVLTAARKGHRRVTGTVRTVTATAQQIRPQLPSLPRPTLNIPSLPKATGIRELAPALAAKLPSTDQLKAGAHELADQFMAVQRKVVGQVRSAATPLAHQAAAVLAQVGTPAAAAKPTTAAKPATASISKDADAEHGRSAAGQNGASTRKPKARPAAKSATKPAAK